MLIFSSIGPFVRTVALPVPLIICITSAMSALLLLAWFILRGDAGSLDIRGHRRWLLLSAVCIFGNVFCYYNAYRMTTMANAVITHYTAPVFAMEGYLPFAAPVGTPREILEKIAEGVREASQTPQLKQLREQFCIPNLPVADLPQVRKEWTEDSAEWIKLAQDLGITLD